MPNREKLEILHEMFQSKGWEIFHEQLADQEKSVNQIASVEDEKQLFFSKGRLFTIRECLTLPELVKAALDTEEELIDESAA